jgi:hypothetical protein
MVAVSLEEDEPKILVRERPHIVEKFTYEFRQPYHTAEKMPIEKAGAFISRVESEAKRLAEETIRSVETNLRKQGYKLTHFGLLLASARPLPNLEKVLSSHALIHTADGELFRTALAYAGERSGISAFTIKENDLMPIACKTLGMKSDNLLRRLRAMGKPFGAPWSQDEKFAALAAWLALCKSTNRTSVEL